MNFAQAETVRWTPEGTWLCVNGCHVSYTAKLLAMIVRKTRNVSLTPELEAFIDSTVASGRYRSASEVVRAALRLLSEREQRMKHQNRQAANAPHLDR
jgi:antitoxin ParD1/3/4